LPSQFSLKGLFYFITATSVLLASLLVISSNVLRSVALAFCFVAYAGTPTILALCEWGLKPYTNLFFPMKVTVATALLISFAVATSIIPSVEAPGTFVVLTCAYWLPQLVVALLLRPRRHDLGRKP